VVLKVKYPQGGEKQLIKAILGREVPPPPGLPLDVGVVVHNVGTTYAIAQAVKYGKPLIERVVTVSGKAVREPKNLLVRLGTPFSELIDYCGGFSAPPVKVVMGGPMMGLPQFDLSTPVVKGTSGLLLLTEDEVTLAEEGVCIRCGRCIDVCPMNLLPTEIAAYCRNGMWDEAEALDVLACIECGSCAYNCPARIPLVHYFKTAKAEINARRKAQAKAKS